MYFIIALILHLFGSHSSRPYGRDFDDEWNNGVGKDEFRCVICKKIFKNEATQ